MNTRILFPDEEGLVSAAEAIRSGSLVAMPTETVYGLAADGLNPAAVAEIYRVKGRPQDNPLILHIASLDMLYPLVVIDEETDSLVRKIAARFWPGPLTMVLPRSEKVPDIITAGGPTVAIRMPSHEVAHRLIALSETPIAAPSANLSGKPSPTLLSDVVDDLAGRIPVILDGGECAVGVESTVIDLTHRPFAVLRPGGVSREELEDCLGEPFTDVSSPVKGVPVRSPGMKYKHYAPSTPLTAVCASGEASAAYILEKDNDACVIAFDEYVERFEEAGFKVLSYGREADSAAQAKNLFLTLRKADRLGVPHLYIQMSPDKSGCGAAVYNRTLRACGGDIVTI